ncbi:alpha/beta hydrolase [Aliiroseovarius sp.]|uniref:alpha/beta fold hydrolase n=1 Tax=Aliiroseovarius sp. TaxID=1872442 RepID=UPI002636B94F|nr:alpha/beta hydrolase [Aliiroseovarius sp.]
MTSTTLPLSDGGILSFREAGRGAPVVLIHGVGLQSAAWGPQVEALAGTHRVIALDMPGHGGSSPLSEGAELPEYVAWLARALVALGLEKVSLAGHSMGALITLGFAATHPECVTRAALLNPVYRRSAEARAAVVARAGEIRQGGIDPDTPLSRWFSDSPADRTARADVARWLAEVNPHGYATAYGAFARGDATYAGRIGAITCPFWTITGDGDPNSTPGMARAIAEAAPRGRALVIAGHRHMVNLTAPDAVNAALRDWLTCDTEGATP